MMALELRRAEGTDLMSVSVTKRDLYYEMMRLMKVKKTSYSELYDVAFDHCHPSISDAYRAHFWSMDVLASRMEGACICSNDNGQRRAVYAILMYFHHEATCCDALEQSNIH
jgi:hypothetical protein